MVTGPFARRNGYHVEVRVQHKRPKRESVHRLFVSNEVLIETARLKGYEQWDLPVRRRPVPRHRARPPSLALHRPTPPPAPPASHTCYAPASPPLHPAARLPSTGGPVRRGSSATCSSRRHSTTLTGDGTGIPYSHGQGDLHPHPPSPQPYPTPRTCTPHPHPLTTHPTPHPSPSPLTPLTLTLTPHPHPHPSPSPLTLTLTLTTTFI